MAAIDTDNDAGPVARAVTEAALDRGSYNLPSRICIKDWE